MAFIRQGKGQFGGNTR